MSPRYCPCGFDVLSVRPRFSAAWHRAHRDHHLATYPNVDQGTRAALADIITLAEHREAERELVS